MNNDLQPQNIKSVDFGFKLAMSLICPHIAQPSLIDINSSVVRKIEIVLGKKISSKHVKTSSGFFPHQSEKRRRCDACISKINPYYPTVYKSEPIFKERFLPPELI